MSTINDIVTDEKSASARKAKELLNQFVVKIDKHLSDYFDNEIKNSFGVSTKERALTRHIWKHIKEHNLRPAKRLRGSFVYYGYSLLHGKSTHNAMKAAMGVELIHTALLMHDDFMDQDDTRRGKPTSHEYYKNIHIDNNYRFDSKHYGESMSVTVGDMALLAGHELIGRSTFPEKNKNEALNRTFRGIVNTGIGQAFDVTLESIGNATEKDILDLHHAKTAIYTYENPLHIGALLAGAKERDLELISKYAIQGGIAFQLQDDILGLFGDPIKTGKPAHSDLRQGKITLLILYALKHGNKDHVNSLLKIWGKRDLTESEARKARNIVIETGSLDHSKKVSIAWARKAQESIPMMRKKKWNEEAIDYLNGIAQYMVEREL